MREVTDHKINPANDTIVIEVVDEPGSGGANHAYCISGFDLGRNPGVGPGFEDVVGINIYFQNGPIPEAGVNGVTQEVLLAIVIDRLRSFQKGPYACRENELALQRAEESLHWLQQRTIARMRRGVEGQHKA